MNKTHTLASILVSTLLASSMTIASIWYAQRVDEHATTVQSALAQKQHEVTALSQMVAQQNVQIRELSSRAGTVQSIEAGPWMRMTATWYSPEGGQGGGTITRSGTPVKAQWTVAVDPKVIPLGSLVEVRYADGTDRIYRATDTGGAIRGHRIDVFDWDKQKCLQNGRQTVMVRILVRG